MPDTMMRSFVRLRRNFADYAFQPTMLDIDKRGCVERLQEALAGREFTLWRLAELSDEQFWTFSTQGLLSAQMRQTPEAALFTSADGGVMILCNMEDHLQIQVEAPGQEIAAAIVRAKELSRLIHEHYPFAKDERIGWLTARPQHAGTGLQVYYLLHLPMLTMMQQIKSINAGLLREHRFSLSALDGEEEKSASALYYLCNMFTAYDSSEKLSDAVRQLAETLSGREINLRDKILKRSIRSTYLDQVYRAFGVLKYARRLNEAEFLGYWSKLRLGAAAGLFSIGLDAVDSLLDKTSPARLISLSKGIRDDHAIHFTRADIVRAELEGET